jgi:FtsH-binding integral membrane protein
MNDYRTPYGTPSQLGVRPAAALSTAFLTQAFTWMFVGLLLTTVVGWFVSQASETTLTKLAPLVVPLILAQLVVALVLSFAIRSIPATVGLLLFFVYAALTGVTLGFVLLLYTSASVLAAGLSAASVFGGAALYGAVTKRDLTGLGAYLFMALFGLIAAGFVNIILLHSETISLIYSIAAVLIFTVLTAYDVQRIQRGDVAAWAGTMEKGAVMGAFRLYLDFINLFFALLRLMGNRR